MFSIFIRIIFTCFNFMRFVHFVYCIYMTNKKKLISLILLSKECIKIHSIKLAFTFSFTLINLVMYSIVLRHHTSKKLVFLHDEIVFQHVVHTVNYQFILLWLVIFSGNE